MSDNVENIMEEMKEIREVEEAPKLPPEWSNLPKKLKLYIIEMLDKKSRRTLRRCSRADKELVVDFGMKKEMEIKCLFDQKVQKWFCSYYSVHRGSEKLKIYFDTKELAYQHLAAMLPTIKLIDSFVQLRNDNELANVRSFLVKFTDGYDKVQNRSIDHLFNQLILPNLEYVDIKMSQLRDDQAHLIDRYFELERTTLNLKYCTFQGPVSQETILAIKTNIFNLVDSSISVARFVHYVQTMLVTKPRGRFFTFENVGMDLQMYLFGEAYDYIDGQELILAAAGMNEILRLSFEVRYDMSELGPGDSIDDVPPNTRIETTLECFTMLGYGELHHKNAILLRRYPTLRRLILASTEKFPEGGRRCWCKMCS